jgi:hypothetical protein
MTTATTRAQVCTALISSKCTVPDFITREKTSLVWNKVYISIQNDELRFVELNLLQRIIRYLIGSYTDTILDKATLEKVKEYVHSIKTATDYGSIAKILLEEARGKHDYECLKNLLSNDNEQDAVLEDGFSKDFLTVTIALAKQNLERDPEDKMWQSITEVFLYTLNIEAVLNNEGILRAVLGLPFVFQIPSQCIRVEDKEIEEAVRKRLSKVSDILEGKDSLKILGLLEKIDQDKDLPEVLRPFCCKIEQKLREALINSRVYPSLVEAYLDDKKQLAKRLFYHLDLGFVHPSLSDRNASQSRYRAAVMDELHANYEVAEFFLAKMTWREQIANGLFKAEHRVFADRRAKELDLTLDEYFQWVADSESAIGLPELELLSKITGQPVVIVCLKQKKKKSINSLEPIGVDNEKIWLSEEHELPYEIKNFDEESIEVDNEEMWHAKEDEWIDDINLSFDKEPIIFNVDNEKIWHPIELKRIV